MTSWLMSQLLPLSIALILLLVGHRHWLGLLGASGIYKLWALVPVVLIMSVIPMPQLATEMIQLPVQQYLVTAGQVSDTSGVAGIWLGIWASGVGGIFAFWLLSQYNYMRSLAWRPVTLEHSDLSLPKLTRIFSSPGVDSPMITGLFRPTLVLPEDFNQRFTPLQQRLILQHELCHWQRGDLLWNLVALSLLLLFWFNPLCWLAYQRYRQDQELACDQHVLNDADEKVKIAYGKALLKSLENNAPIGALHLQYGSKETMKQRIKLLKANQQRPVWRALVVAMVGLAGLSSISHAGGEHTSAAMVKSAELAPVMRIEPKYPYQAAKDGVTGEVLLAFDVTATGAVDNIKILHSRPEGVFDIEASKALAQWKYTATGKRTADKVMLNFELDMPAEAANVEKIRVTPHH